MKSPPRVFIGLLMLLAVVASLFSLNGDALDVARGRPAAYPGGEPFISGLSDNGSPLVDKPGRGPIVGQSAVPTVWNGDLRDLVPSGDDNLPHLEVPRPGIFGDWPTPSTGTADAVVQSQQGPGQMPDPIMGFEGLQIGDGGGWHPPDTHGDVGPNHYMQTVNIALGIYDKTTGAELVNVPYNTFFSPAPSPCNNQNRGDVIVLYDPIVDRWLVTDFSLPSSGPVYECIAISQSGDPISGGWYYYAFEADDDGSPWNDYPKLGVWSDGYYMTANMFDPWSGAWIWALDRDDMLVGDPIDWVLFESGTAYGSLLPANVRGDLPPAGAPNYLLAVDAPDTLHLWKFYVDWDTPGNSHLDGPTDITVAPFSMLPWSSAIPQKNVAQLVDSIGDRLMCQLQYRNYDDYEALFVNHTVASGNSGGVRWYELRDPGGTPIVHQQGTFQPDDHYRWMGSIAADGDGNLALGYSVSSSSLYPSIRYTGQLQGETLGVMAQGEASLKEGTGSQSGSARWGDYSAMTVDPVDDCTFWYTQMYIPTTSSNWSTYIGSFRFPSCGQPKGWIEGTVRDLATAEPLAGAPVFGEAITMTFSALTDADGHFTMTMVQGTYTVTAGPLLPGYPNTNVVVVPVPEGAHVQVNLYLQGVPDLVADLTMVDDNVPGGNNNGYPEPGESGLLLYEQIRNTGATTATNIAGHLVALTPGVEVTVADASYSDIGAGTAALNDTAFVFSIAPTVTCGAQLDFEEIVTTDQGVFTVPIVLYAKVPLPRVSLFADDMEDGQGGWVTGGYPNTWALTTLYAHSPSHSWTDSPSGNYGNNANNWVRSPALDASGINGLELSFWHRYDTEATYDFGYVEYSADGGSTWLPYMAAYDGLQDAFIQETLNATALDDHANIAFRFRFQSDAGVVEDGWYIDDVDVTYEPFGCYYQGPDVPTLLAPPDGTVTGTQTITFTWEPAAGGGTPEGYNLELGGSTLYTTTDTWLGLSLTAGLHTWRVRAYNSGGLSNYADPWTIQVQEPPAVPELLAPPDGTILTTTHDVTLTWQAGAGYAPDWYDLALDGMTQTVTMTTYPTTLPAGEHTWQVRACNTAGCSDYTAAWTLDIVDAPAVPELLAPPDGTVTTTQAVQFTWQPSTTGSLPDWYNVEVDGTVYTETAANLSLTLGFGDHTWRVRAHNQAGSSAYTAAWNLTIVEPAGVPMLLAPADGAVTTTATFTFTWQAGAGGAPDGYNLELDGTVITTTAPLYTATLMAGDHSWRVRAYNAAGYTDYGASWTVTVQEVYRFLLPLVLK